MKTRKTIKLSVVLAAMAILALFMSINAVADTPEGLSESTPTGISQPVATIPMAGPYALVTIDVATISWADGTDTGYTISGGGTILTLTSTGPYKLTGTALDKQIKIGAVMGQVTIEIDGLTLSFTAPAINGANKNDCALDFTNANVKLSLSGTNIIYSGFYRAGIETTGGSLIIEAGTGADTLFAASVGTDGTSTPPTGTLGFGAGIGGGGGVGTGGAGGNITISGGTISANSDRGAGIGGGGGTNGGAGGNITISGGTISANSYNGAGVGGAGGGAVGVGTGGAGGNITISGGTISANSDIGAGVGGGEGAGGGNITISGGTISASSYSGAGIGGGGSGATGGAGATLSISGTAEVKARSMGAPDVGGGSGATGGASGSLSVEGDALLTLGNGNTSTSGGKPTLTATGNGIIINGSDGSLMQGSETPPQLSLSIDKTIVVAGENIIFTVSTINRAGFIPQGTVEIYSDSTKIATLTSGNTAHTYTAIAGYHGITAKYIPVVNDIYTAATTPSTSISVTHPTLNLTGTMPNGRIGDVYTGTVSTTGGDGAYTYALVGALPDGVNLSGNTLSGTPTAAGTFPFSITAASGDGQSKTLNFNVIIAKKDDPVPIQYPVGQIPSAANNYTMKVDVDFADFSGVTIGGIALTAADFTSWSGSTFVRLNPSYLNSLVAGSHTIVLNFTNGTATATFTKTATGGGTGGSGTSSGSGSSSIADTYKTPATTTSTTDANYNPSTGGGAVLSLSTIFVGMSLLTTSIHLFRKKFVDEICHSSK